MTELRYKSKSHGKVLWEGLLWLLYGTVQFIISLIFTPNVPEPNLEKPLGKIAIIGAGVTGVSSAAHCIAHGFDVVIYEQKPKLGGIWAAVNQTSSLQLSSFLYRFHPSVIWSHCFPVKQHEILSEITRIWETYHLESRTKFNYTVRDVQRCQGVDGKTRWLIDGGQDGMFDGVIVAIGTCGIPKACQILGRDRFKGPVVHSSDLDGLDLHNKRVSIIGGGASGVEAAELAVHSGAADVVVLARSDKWFIPRNWIISVILGFCPKFLQNSFGLLVERALLAFHYQDVKYIAPGHKRFFSETPIVNNLFFQHVRSGRARYIRGDLLEIVSEGLKLNVRNDRTSKPGTSGVTEVLEADVIIDATGYERPTYDFLPKLKLFPSEYSPPHIFLQTFSTAEPTCLMTNAAYFDAIAGAGHVHIGLATRMLMMFILHPETAPKPLEMKRWVDQNRGLEFFTYCEFMTWHIRFHMTSIARARWAIFNFSGWGFKVKSPPSHRSTSTRQQKEIL